MTNSFIRDIKEVLRRLRNRGISFDANRQYPAIPTIDNSIESHTNALRAIREAIETHERRNPKASLDSFVRLYELEDVLGGFQPGESSAISWATHDEVDAGAPRYKAVDPETGAYAYDRLRHVGQHTAGKGTASVTAAPSAGVVTIDCKLSNVFDVPLTAATVEVANPVDPIGGQTINIHFRQDAEGGRGYTFGTAWTFVNGVDPVPTADPLAVDLLSCQWDSTSAKMRCAFLPDFGSGNTEAPPPAGADLVFVNVGGGNNVYRDTVGLNVNLRTFAAEGDISVRTEGDQIIYSYTAPIAPPSSLASLSDVDLTGIVDDDYLKYAGGVWVPAALPVIPDTTVQTFLTEADETATLPNSRRLVAGSRIDLDVSVAGEMIVSVNTDAPTALNDLADVDTTGAADGNALVYDAGTSTWVPGEGGGGGGGGGGGTVGSLAYVGTAVVTGAAAQDITLSGLDLAADQSYYIDWVIENATGSVSSIALFYNGDTTAANYDAVLVGAEGGTLGSGGNNLGQIVQNWPANATITGSGWIRNNLDGKPGFWGQNNGIEAATRRMQTIAHTWRTAANITSITLRHSSASGFSIGSKFRVYKLTDTYGGGQSVAQVARTALQNFSTTAQAVSWDTEEADTEGYYSGVNPTRITFPVSGWYTLIANVWQSVDADDMQTLWFAKNGAAYSVTQTQTRMGAGSTAVAAGTNLMETAYYAAGDYIELFVDNRSGTSSAYARMSVFRMSGPTGPQGIQGPVGDTSNVQLRGQEDDLVLTSNASFNDTDLVSGELQPGVYAFEILAVTTNHATPDLKRRLDFTGTATDVSWMYTTDGVAGGSGYYTAFGSATDGSQTVTGVHITTAHGKFTVTAAGRLKWQIGQVTSSATSITFQKGSWMRITDLTGVNPNTIDEEIALDSPRGYWKLDESSGNLADSSGNGYTLTITGSPIDAYAFAATNPDFPTRKTPVSTAGGQSSYAGEATALGLTLPVTTYTMEAWGKWTSSGILMAIGANGETAATNFAGQLLVTAGGLLSQFWEYGAGTNAPTINSLLGGILDGKLHHLVSVKDAAALTVKYYIDGVYVGGGTYTGGQEHTSGTSGVFSIMGSPGDSTAAPDGLYAGAAFYTTALSEARIQAHARALGLFD